MIQDDAIKVLTDYAATIQILQILGADVVMMWLPTILDMERNAGRSSSLSLPIRMKT